MRDPKQAVKELLLKYWPSTGPSDAPGAGEIHIHTAPLDAKIMAPQVSISQLIRHRLKSIGASPRYRAFHTIRIRIGVRGVENEADKWKILEKIRNIILSHPTEAEDINFIRLGDGKDDDNLRVKPPFMIFQLDLKIDYELSS